MAKGNSVNDEIREQHQKMKGKTPKEKFAYFWEYYKVHTLVVILAVVFVSSFIYSVATQKETVMEAAFVNTYLGQDADTEVMASDFAQYSGLDTSRYQAVIDGSMMVSYDGSDQYSYANMQKLMAMVAAQTLDSVITDDAYLEQNLESGMFSDLSLYFTEEELAQYEDRLLYKDLPEDGTDEERPVAIDVRDSKYMLSDQVPAWFTIISNSKHPENAKQFLLFLLEE